MQSRIRLHIVLTTCVVAALLIGSCGKKSEDAAEEAKKPQSDLLNIAKLAGGVVSLEEEAANILPMLEAAGFEALSYEQFPGLPSGQKGRLLAYAAKGGKSSGGVIYMTKAGSTVSPCWHWYFDNMAPDSVTPVELNDDGLWDMRVVSKDGRVVTFIHDDTFTFASKERADWLALNSSASPSASEGESPWRCFDGDSTTAWRAATGQGSPAFIELNVPFGVRDGVLGVRTLDKDRPRTCTLYADGKKVDQLQLEETAATHLFSLGKAVQGAKRVRLEFEPVAGTGHVAIAELTLK